MAPRNISREESPTTRTNTVATGNYKHFKKKRRRGCMSETHGVSEARKSIGIGWSTV